MSLNNKRKNKVQHDIKEQETAVSQEEAKQNAKAEEVLRKAVSYTHLTLPTIYSV